MLFPDTFDNFLHPEVAKAAGKISALEHAGYWVSVLRESLCCGRPLFNYGMLDAARGLFGRLTRSLALYVREGIRVVGIEPSCVAAFRDGLPDMLPHDQDARHLSANTPTLALAEFLVNEAVGYEPPKDHRPADSASATLPSTGHRPRDKQVPRKTRRSEGGGSRGSTKSGSRPMHRSWGSSGFTPLEGGKTSRSAARPQWDSRPNGSSLTGRLFTRAPAMGAISKPAPDKRPRLRAGDRIGRAGREDERRGRDGQPLRVLRQGGGRASRIFSPTRWS